MLELKTLKTMKLFQHKKVKRQNRMAENVPVFEVD